MKRAFHTSMVYMVLSLISGVFYREYTKYMGFQGKTTLAVSHVHLFVLDTLFFLLLTLFMMHTTLEQQREYRNFYVLYQIALPSMVIVMIMRGIIQMNALTLSAGMNAMIAGFAGITHIMITIALVFFAKAMNKALTEKEQMKQFEKEEKIV